MPLTPERVYRFVQTMVGWHFDHLVTHPRLRRILAWEAAEGWETLNRARHGGVQTCPGWVGPIREFITQAQAESIVRQEVDPYMAMAFTKSMVLIHLLSLPNYEAMFAHDFSSSSALERARAQLISFAAHAFMTPAALAQLPDTDRKSVV